MMVSNKISSMVLVFLLLCAPVASAQKIQDQQTENPAAQEQRVVVLPATSTWRIGIKMTGTGVTSRAKVTFPLPVDWPEQAIEIVSIDASENVEGAKIKKLGTDASQMFFRVPRLAAEEVAEIFVTVRIVKSESTAPQDTSIFVLGKGKGRKFRDYLTPSPFIESNHREIKEIAEALPIAEDDPAWKQVETIYNWVRDNIEYQFDMEIRSCLDALDSRKGDCEELSSMFVALCRARGIPARAVWIPKHTYPEFYLEDAEGNGHWFPCQCAGSYAFGHMPEAKPILQKGDKFRISGHSKPLRYIQPTVKAYGAHPQWDFTIDEIENADDDK